MSRPSMNGPVKCDRLPRSSSRIRRSARTTVWTSRRKPSRRVATGLTILGCPTIRGHSNLPNGSSPEWRLFARLAATVSVNEPANG